MTGTIELPRGPLIVGRPDVVPQGLVSFSLRWQLWHDPRRMRNRDLRWYGTCILCECNLWAFDDGEDDRRGVPGNNTLRPIGDDGQPRSRTCVRCVSTSPRYGEALEIVRTRPAREWRVIQWPGMDR